MTREWVRASRIPILGTPLAQARKAAANYLFLYLAPLIAKVSGRRRGTLVYLGANKGESLVRRQAWFGRVVAFEPNPILFEGLRERFRHVPRVELYPFAISDSPGEVVLHLPNNSSNFAAASLLHFSKGRAIEQEGEVAVQAIVLPAFLEDVGVSVIDLYVSDIEGLDYRALASMSGWIEAKRVRAIQCEVLRSGKSSPYEQDCASEEDFDALLQANYRKVAWGENNLKSGVCEQVPADYLFHDVLWELR